MRKMPVVFSGHGSPMIALEDNSVTRGMKEVGDKIIERFGKPKAILVISGHWFKRATYIQAAETPKQIYDMYGFPEELYQVKYPVKGCADLSNRVMDLLGDEVKVNDDWGIDHGTWTVLCHMFPDADIPVVQLSVDISAEPHKLYEIGEMLSALRDEGYLIFGSGNVVHNLRMVDWSDPDGSPRCVDFNDTFIKLLSERNDEAIINYEDLPNAAYAAPTSEHFLPIIYLLGAAKGEKTEIFNNVCNLSAIAMTGFVIGWDE